jgi:hypothetical protein
MLTCFHHISKKKLKYCDDGKKSGRAPKKIGRPPRPYSRHNCGKMSSMNTSATNTMSAPAAAKKTVKKVTPAASEAPAPAPPAPVATPAAAEKKSTKKPATTVPTPAPVAPPAPVAAPAPVEAPTTSEATETSLADEIKALQDQLTSVRDAANAALTALKRVAKRATTEIKEARKNKRKVRAEPADGEPRKPSNFEIPVPISDELSVFLGGGKNNKMSRAQVTRAINNYLNTHNLRSKHDITPDAPLRKLLGIGDDVKLTLFNIQTYLSKHYPKAPKA